MGALAHKGRVRRPQQLTRPVASRTRAATLRSWLASRHGSWAEVLLILAFWAAYEGSRGFVMGSREVAVENAHRVVSLERSLNIYVEQGVQDGAHAIPGLVGALSLSYLTLHLGVTVGLLIWLHRRRPEIFPLVRTTLLVSSGLALIGYLAYPTAPPRLAGIGIADTVSSEHVDLNTGLVSSLYNPFAAVPSMHFGYALIVAAVLVAYSDRRAVRVVGALYAPFVLLMIVATGNHFFVDAIAGAGVVVVAYGATRLLLRARTSTATALAPRALESSSHRIAA